MVGSRYTAANGSSYVPASVKVETPVQGTNGLTSVYQYDALGRLILESIVGAGVPRYRTTVYDALGRKTTESVLLTTPAASPATTYVYDALDRPVSVQAPDLSVTTFDYNSDPSATKRTVMIHTASGDSPAITKELHDRQNRLAEVIEPDETVTDYTYDVADHLTKVDMGVQERTFVYDGRGFLKSETHPEIGQNGKGTTSYDQYDAHGHARHKLTGSSGGAYDLSFAYDLSERLTSISDTGGSHLLKAFTFGTDNGTSPADYRKGKLITATRYNPMPSPLSGDLAVIETYKYQNTSGKPSERETEVKSGTTTVQSFQQMFTYDPLGAVTAPGYPTCLSPVTCSAIPSYATATNVYANGLLSNVQGFGTLGYNNNGTLGSVTHSNGVVDTIAPDVKGMPRLQSIVYTGWSAQTCTPSTPSISAQSTQLPSSNQGTTLTASATGCGGTLSYQWYRGTSGDQSVPLGTGATYVTGALQATTSFWVKVTDSSTSTSANSATEVINVCGAVAITAQPQSSSVANINQGVTLSVSATGCGTLSYQWYRGSSGDTSNGVLGTAMTYATGALSSTTSFWVKVTDSSGPSSVNSNTAVITVAVAPPVPTAVNAFVSYRDPVNQIYRITVTWQGSGASYQVIRCSINGCGTPFSATSGYVDTSVAANLTYAYAVRALDSTGNGVSAFSTYDLATTMTFSSLQPGVTVIQLAHLNELLNGLNSIRAILGQSALTWQAIQTQYLQIFPTATFPLPAVNGPICAVHIKALRLEMDFTLSQIGIASQPYTDDLTTPTLIKAIHFTELQNRTQ